MCNSDISPKGLADVCMRWTWMITTGKHPGTHPTVSTRFQQLHNLTWEYSATQDVLLKGPTKGTGHKTTEN
jgi:hypothetical protein